MIDNIMGNGLDVPLSGLREAAKWDIWLCHYFHHRLSCFQGIKSDGERGSIWEWLLQEAQYLHPFHQSGDLAFNGALYLTHPIPIHYDATSIQDFALFGPHFGSADISSPPPV